MNDLDRLRDLFPLVVALALFAGLTQVQAARPAAYRGSGYSLDAALAKVRWHMLEIARNERGEALFYPGN